MLADLRVQTFAFMLLASSLVVPCIGVAEFLRFRLNLPRVLFFGIVLIVLGVAAEVCFFVTMLNTTAAMLLMWMLAILGTIETIIAVRRPRFARTANIGDRWAPFGVTLVGATASFALLSLVVPGVGTLLGSINAMGRLPSDDLLPFVLASHIAAHAPPKPFLGEWLSSDRPPLQAGFTLIMFAFTPFIENSETRYLAISILLQSSALGLIYTLCRLIGARPLRSAGVVMLAWCSGFFFLNTLYVWPKLISAAFVAVAVAVLVSPGRCSRSRALAVGGATGLGLLCHGGVVFTIPALLAAWFVTSRRSFVEPFVWAAAVCAAVLAPWSWYQNVYDPPGNRLVNWHLAGQIAPTQTSFPRLLQHAYLETPFRRIATYKIDNLATTLGVRTTVSNFTRKHDREFFFIPDALSALWVPFVAAFAFARSERRPLRVASRFALISVGAIVFWALVLYLPADAVIHQGSYLTMCLMFVAGGIVASEWFPVFVPVALCQFADFSATWIPDVLSLRRFASTGGIIAGTSAVALCCLCVGFFRREIGAEVLRFRRGMSERQRSENNLRAYVDRNWRGIGIVIAVAIVVIPLAILNQRAFVVVPPPPPEQAVPATPSVPKFPDLGRLRRLPVQAPISFDAIVIDGQQHIVAAVKENAVFKVTTNQPIQCVGWAFDPRSATPGGGLAVQINGENIGATYGTPRPDVARVFGLPSLANVGFTVTIDPSTLKPGENTVSIVVLSTDGTGYYLDPTFIRLER